MSTSHVSAGTIILRRWDRAQGLREDELAFQSLDQLYAQCLEADNPQVIDRIVIRGQDASGQTRVVTFVFQSITVSPFVP